MRIILVYVGLLLIAFGHSFAQVLPQKEATLFTCVEEKDTIQFVRFSTDTLQQRPTILYCQGSLPYPLIVTNGEDTWIIAMDVFNYKNLIERFNVILISMPHTPIVATLDQLNDRSEYVPDTSQPDKFDENYVKANYLENYINRGNAVLKFLRRQKWVDQNHLILLGHSQGAHVAAHLAFQNPDISALGYFSGNPMGRFAQLVREKRILSNQGILTQEEAQKSIEGLYTKWHEICSNQYTIQGGDTDETWKSFSKMYLDQLVQLKMPVYITYGTEDPGAQFCDLLPIYFEFEKKENYKLLPFVGRGHNFELITFDGKHNYDDMKWQEAIDQFISWLDTL